MKYLFNKIQPVFIGLCAWCMAAQTFFLLGKSPAFSNQYPVFIGFLTVFGYHFLSKNSSKKTIGWLAGVVAAVLFFENNWPLGRLTIGLVVVSAGYYFPAFRRFFFKKNAPLRASTFGKPATIAIVWAGVTVVPVFHFFGNLGGDPALFLMLAERFFFIAALAIAYDLIDENADRAAKLETIPVRFGAVFSKKAIVWLLFGSAIAVTVQVVSGFYPVVTGAAIFFSLILAALFSHRFPKIRPSSDQKTWIDSFMVLQFLAVWASF